MDNKSEERLWILADVLLCSACRLCEVACSLKHEGKIWPEASRIRIYEYLPGAPVPHFCVQCSDYPCVSACPMKALSVDKKTGAVIVDKEKCTKCGLCVQACPGMVPRIPRGADSVKICDLCGGEPECVKICQEAGYNALRLVKGHYREIFKTYAMDPILRSKSIIKKMYGLEV